MYTVHFNTPSRSIITRTRWYGEALAAAFTASHRGEVVVRHGARVEVVRRDSVRTPARIINALSLKAFRKMMSAPARITVCG